MLSVAAFADVACGGADEPPLTTRLVCVLVRGPFWAFVENTLPIWGGGGLDESRFCWRAITKTGGETVSFLPKKTEE